MPGCVEALARLSISSDASISSPGAVLEQIRDCVLRHGFALEEVLPLATANPARILRLERKGRIEPGMDADLLVLRQDSLELVEVIAGGRRLVAGGALAVHERFLDHTERTLHLQGRSG